MTSPSRRRPAVALAALVAVVVSSWMALALLDPASAVVADNVLLTGSAGVAGLVVLRNSTRWTGRRRFGWVAVAVGLLGWSAGQATYAYQELVVGETQLFPSWADAGYLSLPVCACLGVLLCRPDATGDTPRPVRNLLDGAMVATSVLLTGWAAALGALVHQAPATGFGLTVALAYPLLDVVVLTVVVVVLVQCRGAGSGLAVLGAGIATLTVADIDFLWLTFTSGYTTGDPVDLAWCAAFALMAYASVPARVGRAEGRRTPVDGSSSSLPYLPVAIVLLLLGVDVVRGEQLDTVELRGTGVLLVLVLLRQYLTLRDNQRLAQRLGLRERELQRLALHDDLTGLANRTLFTDRVQHAIARSSRSGTSLAVLFLDLDDFKLVNDTLGHGAGDQLLVAVADRLRGCLRSSDTLARLGGDEFAVLLDDLVVDASAVGSAMIGALTEPVVLSGQRVTVRASVGIATPPPGHQRTDASRLLAQADMAMYAAKRDGTGEPRAYTPDLLEGRAERLELGARIPDAVVGGEIHLAFQPVVDLETGETTGAEALARWRGPEGNVSPEVFIPLVDRAGLGGVLVAAFAHEICSHIAQWNAARGDRRLHVGLNLSPDQLLDPDLTSLLSQTVARYGVDPGQLVLEITEAGLFRDPDLATSTVATLREAGFLIALDDFGTGYSSMTHLADFHPDFLKIDRSFISPLPESEHHERFLRALISLADGLGLTTVAEGIETREQLELVRSLGCTRGQGYLMARPMSVEDLSAVVTAVPVPVSVPAPAPTAPVPTAPAADRPVDDAVRSGR